MQVRRSAGCALSAVVLLSGCVSTAGSDPAAPAPTHDHAAGANVSLPVGDGTSATEVGYRLRAVELPSRAGEPGRISFVIDDYRGRPQTRYLVEQAKEMHVYVVRDDLAVFRHVHPELRRDGTWSGNLTLPEPGDYRVVTEFVARDEGGNGDHIVLGARRRVPGDWSAQAAPAATGKASDWGVTAEVLTDVTAGDGQEMQVRVTRADGATTTLGQYLGTSAHLTGFHVDSGAVVHMHPLGAPANEGGAAELRFHAELPEPGEYVLFLQLRVDDFLHTIPLTVGVA